MKGFFKQEQEGAEDVSNGRYLSVYSTVDGPKLRDLCKRLNTSSFEALGILVFFWLWGQNNTNEAGEILNASEEDIARYLYGVGVGCNLAPNDVVAALVETGWIDKAEGKLVIHDWETWQSDWLSAQARREKDAKRKAVARRGAGSGDEPAPGEADGSIQYSKPFEEFWLAYPRKDEKGSAYKKYMARLKNGYSAEDLLSAAKNYALQCKRKGTERQFIKQCKTFLSDTMPFTDYLPKKKDAPDDPNGNPYSRWG